MAECITRQIITPTTFGEEVIIWFGCWKTSFAYFCWIYRNWRTQVGIWRHDRSERYTESCDSLLRNWCLCVLDNHSQYMRTVVNKFVVLYDVEKGLKWPTKLCLYNSILSPYPWNIRRSLLPIKGKYYSIRQWWNLSIFNHSWLSVCLQLIIYRKIFKIKIITLDLHNPAPQTISTVVKVCYKNLMNDTVS